MNFMNRREALKSVVLMMGGTMVGANVILTGCAPDSQIEGLDFSEDELAYMDEIGEAIIPTTDTPGAKAAGIGSFMAMMVKSTYTEEQQKSFINGLNKLKSDFKAANKKDFMDATVEERTNFLNQVNKKAMVPATEDNKEDKYILMIKDLTLLGYFTSEIGATQALRFVETPGRYEPCIEYKKGDRAWAI
ncbi:Twin-arginine translocation pathway signal [Cyclobacterium amurskyense]|uniref:Twin-arginine translocation pathway signal n=2 Tax=Cyclobacterium amurskyense TaxID=320787 RepID=A0A0H4PAJ8_9BACT|nr:Twin-arginine translocation pathway signal [Cyclobacterium amurskyense]|tara:strand:+ start:19343 stop:19912 length:570 start_codon:yes stop_codon:yes gene_type:complete